MKWCKLCRRPDLTVRLDFGLQPLSNRFLRGADEPQYTHPLALGVCSACGLVQLDTPPPVEEVRPRFDWLSDNEPENHLDDLAQRIRQLPGLPPSPTVCGLTYKDASLLRRLREQGADGWLADPRADLGVEHPHGGTASIQARLTRATAEGLVQKHGRPTVVLLRYVLEHAHDLHQLLGALHTLVAPDGYLVVEVPDCRRPLEHCDYSSVWEEHVFHFTPATLRQCFARTGFRVVFLRSYPALPEDTLVAVVRPGEPTATTPSPTGVQAEVERLQQFGDRFPALRARYEATLSRVAREEGPVAMLGAGHRGAAFINRLGLGHVFAFVTDDHPRKQGLFLPGSRLPIVATDRLLERGVLLCLLAVRPEIEEAVVQKNRAFTHRGGRLASIFPDSPHALRVA